MILYRVINILLISCCIMHFLIIIILCFIRSHLRLLKRLINWTNSVQLIRSCCGCGHIIDSQINFMFLNEFWIWVLVKLIVDVTLNCNFIIRRLLAEKTGEEGVVAKAVASQSLITYRLVLAVRREHEHDENREQNTETGHIFHYSHVERNSVFQNRFCFIFVPKFEQILILKEECSKCWYL